jgi:UDP-N-acetylmuramate--alanine ligase
MATADTGNPAVGAYTGAIDLSRPHFVGVGGSTMAGLAKLCATRGSVVTGTHATDSPRIAALREAGCSVQIGHDPRAIEQATCVVFTTATGRTPEVATARVQGIPVVHRAQALQHLAGENRLVAAAGTHGKSTTAGMLVAALRQLHQDPSYVIGADLGPPGSGAHSGTGELFVAEADESDRSFQLLRPAAAVITTIEYDHPENFDDVDSHVAAYVTFAARVQHQGVLVANADEDASRDMARRVRRLRPDLKILTFGRSDLADVRIVRVDRQGWNTSMSLVVIDGGQAEIHLPTPNLAHGTDAVAALALLVGLGFGHAPAAEALCGFTGLPRRFAFAGEASGVTVVDCHAVHPREFSTCLEAARVIAGTGRVVAVVQPCGYARVRVLGGQIGEVLAAGTDCTILLDIDGDAPIPGVSSALVGNAAVRAGGTVWHRSAAEAADLLPTLIRPGDVVLLMGVDAISALAEPVLAALQEATDQYA